jgi:hypothetical protein
LNRPAMIFPLIFDGRSRTCCTQTSPVHEAAAPISVGFWAPHSLASSPDRPRPAQGLTLVRCNAPPGSSPHGLTAPGRIVSRRSHLHPVALGLRLLPICSAEDLAGLVHTPEL